MTLAHFTAPGREAETVELLHPAADSEGAWVVFGLDTGMTFLAWLDELAAITPTLETTTP